MRRGAACATAGALALDAGLDPHLAATVPAGGWRCACASGLLREAQTLYTPSSASTTARKATTAKSTKDGVHARGLRFRPLRRIGANSDSGRSMPRVTRRSQKRGRTPVALKWPSTAPVVADAGLLEDEDLLHRHRLAFHAGDLLDAGQLARAVAQPVRLDDDADRGGDLRPRRLGGQVHAGHRDHAFEPRQRVARRVGMHRGHRAFVAGVHRLQHVERLGTARLAQDDAVGPHAQRVAHQRALRHFAAPLDVRRPGLQAHDVRLLQLQLGRILDRHDPLVDRDVAG